MASAMFSAKGTFTPDPHQAAIDEADRQVLAEVRAASEARQERSAMLRSLRLAKQAEEARHVH